MSLDKEPLLINEDVEFGGKPTILEDFAYRNNVTNATINVRMAFIRKVYSLLGVQLMMTVALCSVTMFSSVAKFFVRNNVWMILVAFFATIVILIALHIKRRDHPVNLYLLASFTIVQSYSVAVVVTFYDQLVVLEALFLTLAVVAALTGYTFQSKKDFSFMGAGLSAALCVFMLASILQVFVGGSAMDFWISVGGALLFSFFIIYDTHMIMQNLSPEEYILATINLYLDIINLFIYILRIIGQSSRN